MIVIIISSISFKNSKKEKKTNQSLIECFFNFLLIFNVINVKYIWDVFQKLIKDI